MPVITKNKCQYKLQNGANKGKACGNPCKEVYCYRHTERTIQKKKEYGSKTRVHKTVEKIKKETDVKKLPKLPVVAAKKKGVYADIQKLYKKRMEIEFKLGEIDKEEYYRKMRIICYKSCINKKTTENELLCASCIDNKFKKCVHCDDILCKHCTREPWGFDLISDKLDKKGLKEKDQKIKKKIDIKTGYYKRLAEKIKLIEEKTKNL